jgi:hypothetical protein
VSFCQGGTGDWFLILQTPIIKRLPGGMNPAVETDHNPSCNYKNDKAIRYGTHAFRPLVCHYVRIGNKNIPGPPISERTGKDRRFLK